MDLTLSEEQRLLSDEANRFLAENYDFASRALAIASDTGMRSEIWRQFAEMGWLGLPFSEEYGGLTGSRVDMLVMMQAMGRKLVVEPYLSTVVMGGGLVELIGTEAQKAAIVPRITDGTFKLAVAYAESSDEFDLSRIGTAAQPCNRGFIINGAKSVVFGAPSADFLIVAASLGGSREQQRRLAFFLIPKGARGMSMRSYPTIDGGRAADVTLTDVQVEVDALLGPPDDAVAALEQILDNARLATIGEAVGILEEALERTSEYLQVRKQFGRPLAQFQVLRHKIADMFVALEELRSLALWAAFSDDLTVRKRAVSAAKIYIGDQVTKAAQEAIQLHGAIGMTEEFHIGHYLKRITTIDRSFGGSFDHLTRYIAIANRSVA